MKIRNGSNQAFFELPSDKIIFLKCGSDVFSQQNFDSLVENGESDQKVFEVILKSGGHNPATAAPAQVVINNNHAPQQMTSTVTVPAAQTEHHPSSVSHFAELKHWNFLTWWDTSNFYQKGMFLALLIAFVFQIVALATPWVTVKASISSAGTVVTQYNELFLNKACISIVAPGRDGTAVRGCAPYKTDDPALQAAVAFSSLTIICSLGGLFLWPFFGSNVQFPRASVYTHVVTTITTIFALLPFLCAIPMISNNNIDYNAGRTESQVGAGFICSLIAGLFLLQMLLLGLYRLCCIATNIPVQQVGEYNAVPQLDDQSNEVLLAPAGTGAGPHAQAYKKFEEWIDSNTV